MSAWPSRPSARIAAAFQPRSWLFSQIFLQLGDGLRLLDRGRGFDGRLLKLRCRHVLDGIGVAVAEAVPAEKAGQFKLVGQVGVIRQLR